MVGAMTLLGPVRQTDPPRLVADGSRRWRVGRRLASRPLGVEAAGRGLRVSAVDGAARGRERLEVRLTPWGDFLRREVEWVSYNRMLWMKS